MFCHVSCFCILMSLRQLQIFNTLHFNSTSVYRGSWQEVPWITFPYIPTHSVQMNIDSGNLCKWQVLWAGWRATDRWKAWKAQRVILPTGHGTSFCGLNIMLDELQPMGNRSCQNHHLLQLWHFPKTLRVMYCIGSNTMYCQIGNAYGLPK
jgi:hypothetical protein